MDHLLGDGSHSTLVEVEVAVGVSAGSSLKGVLRDQGVHQSIIGLGVIDVWDNSFIVLVLVRNWSVGISHLCLFGSILWLGSPWALSDVGSILIRKSALFFQLDLEAVGGLNLIEQHSEELRSLSSIKETFMEDIEVVPEILEGVVDESLSLISMVSQVGVDDLMSGISCIALGEIEMSIWLSAGVSLYGVLCDERIHQPIVRLSTEMVGHIPLIVRALLIVDGECSIDLGGSRCVAGAGSPRALRWVWSEVKLDSRGGA